MTIMWHNISANCNPKKDTRLLDREAVILVMQAQVDEIARRLRQNQEPMYGGVRVRLLLERIDG